jgi:hypothetical protein
MKRLESVALLILLLSFVATIPLSAGVEEEYKADCPPEAKEILDAVGGCDFINCSKYPAICEHCCPECGEGYPKACKTKDECEAAGLYWYEGECHKEQKPPVPSFEAVFAIAALLAVSYFLRKRE